MKRKYRLSAFLIVSIISAILLTAAAFMPLKNMARNNAVIRTSYNSAQKFFNQLVNPLKEGDLLITRVGENEIHIYSRMGDGNTLLLKLTTKNGAR